MMRRCHISLLLVLSIAAPGRVAGSGKGFHACNFFSRPKPRLAQLEHQPSSCSSSLSKSPPLAFSSPLAAHRTKKHISRPGTSTSSFPSHLARGRPFQSSRPSASSFAQPPSPVTLALSASSDIMPPPPTFTSSSNAVATTSLASDYVVRILEEEVAPSENRGELVWDLVPLNGDGTAAIGALRECASSAETARNSASMRCSWSRVGNGEEDEAEGSSWNVVTTLLEAKDGEESSSPPPCELVCVLSRIMVQCAAVRIAEASGTNDGGAADNDIALRMTLPLLEGDGCQTSTIHRLLSSRNGNVDGIRELFNPLTNGSTGEIVDMVDAEGRTLGSVPRSLVHRFNLLHRGAGIVVTEGNEPFFTKLHPPLLSSPRVYVHRRTDDKRIFPSLYDMFVGGVSASGESPRLTAAREVAEELGLGAALELMENDGEEGGSPLSEALFRCTVCTSYNRCVVTVFEYACDELQEAISWQEEEVAWGNFVPYEHVEVAGRRSVERLEARRREEDEKEMGSGSILWPGVEAWELLREVDEGEGEMKNVGVVDDSRKEKETHIADAKLYGESEEPWLQWDFVPDGLLVWQAWLSWCNDGHFMKISSSSDE